MRLQTCTQCPYRRFQTTQQGFVLYCDPPGHPTREIPSEVVRGVVADFAPFPVWCPLPVTVEREKT